MHEDTQSQTADPAAEAFENLRKEVALVRSALTGLAAEYSGLEIPDHSQTLSKIMETSKVTTKYLNVIARLPALQQTPDKLAEQIITAGEQARKFEQESLQNACNLFRRERNELSRYMHHHRTAEDQDRLLVKTGWSGVAVGLILYAFFAGAARAIDARKLATAGAHGGQCSLDRSGERRHPPHPDRRTRTLERHRKRLAHRREKPERHRTVRKYGIERNITGSLCNRNQETRLTRSFPRNEWRYCRHGQRVLAGFYGRRKGFRISTEMGWSIKRRVLDRD